MASTLIHTSCPKVRNVMVIRMEQNSFSDSLPNINLAKRDHEPDDLEKNQIKKRRKQSKPSRIASTELGTTEYDIKNIWKPLTDNTTNTINCTNEINKPSLNMIEENRISSKEIECSENRFLPINDFQQEIIPLNLSHVKATSPQSCITSGYSNDDNKTWFQIVDQKSVYQPQVPDSSPIKSHFFQNSMYHSSQSTSYMPSLKRVMMSNSDLQVGTSHRIFNPEAFCDLCNKEFCNKYFLKTHRANKHGIYTDNIGSNIIENLTALPMINYYTNNSLNSSRKTCTPIPTNKNSTTSMRAFCNICQREFCNKYFVRKHKAKIHGIIETSDDDSKNSIMSDKNDMLTENNISDLSPTKSSSNKMCKELGEITVELIKDKSTCDAENEIEDLSCQNFQWNIEEHKNSFEFEKIKSLNENCESQTVFCDICSKEYCNQYFLQVHKHKCHGVVFSDDKLSPSPQIDNCDNEEEDSESLPLNLILRKDAEIVCDTRNEYSCKLCNLIFLSNDLLGIHNEEHHIPIEQLKTDSNCSQQDACDLSMPTTRNESCEIFTNTFDQFLHSDEHENRSMKVKTEPSSSFSQEFNNLETRENPDIITCEICHQEFEELISLENHIMQHHPYSSDEFLLSNDDDNMPNNSENSNNLTTRKSLSNSDIAIDLQMVESKSHLKNNVLNDSSEMCSNNLIISEKQAMQTPTSSFCEICKKELCNKYFMKTHMQRMHGISIENGAQIGGVICDICNKELCSKYFLRVHKQNSHGILDEGILPQIGADGKLILSTDPALRPTDHELNHRYFSHFTEVCCLCNRRFRSIKWLKAHLLNDHGEDGRSRWVDVQLQANMKTPEKCNDSKSNDFDEVIAENLKLPNSVSPVNGPSTSEIAKIDNTQHETNSLVLTTILNKGLDKNYQCSFCPFTTPILALLFVHEKHHVPAVNEVRVPLSSSFCTRTNFNNVESQNFSQNFSSNVNDSINGEVTQSTSNGNNYLSNNHHINIETNGDKKNEFPNLTNSSIPSEEISIKCNKCSFVTQNFDYYNEHLQSEHGIKDNNPNYLKIVRDVLLKAANNGLIPASFAVPKNLGSFMMQPFVLEDKAIGEADASSTFLSSLVFLPVKERLKKPITASFKLTPT